MRELRRVLVELLMLGLLDGGFVELTDATYSLTVSGGIDACSC